MASRGVQLGESATVASYCIWVLCIGHLPFADDVFDTSGHSKRSVSTTSASVIIHLTLLVTKGNVPSSN